MTFNQTASWFRSFPLAIAGLHIFMLSACLDNSASNKSDTGALSFKIAYHDARQSHFQPTAAVMDCAGLNVKTVEANVYNKDNVLLADGGPWNCNDGYGTIASVQPGNGFNVVVSGKDPAGRIIFSGEKKGVLIVANTDNNAGNIDCHPFVPIQQAPTDRTVINAGDIVLKWSEVAGAAKYQVLVSENSDLAQPVVNDATTNVTFAPSGLEPDKTYYWQVYASDSHGKSGTGSARWSFTCAAQDPSVPNLKTPKHQSVIDVGGVVLKWSEVAGTAKYKVAVSENSDLTQPVINDTTTGVTFTPSGLEPDKTYYWQVHTMNANGKPDAASAIWSFTSIANASPDAQITCPLEGIIYTQGDTVVFTSNIEDNAQSDNDALAWSSDLSGEICKGNTCSSNSLIAGTHQITLTATDAEGAEQTDTVTIVVNADPANGGLPDTGQTTSFTDTFGEDADYIINPPAYTKLDAAGQVLAPCAAEWAMVKDEVTGLIWEVKTDDDTIHDKDNLYAWHDLRNKFITPLNDANFGGHTDWRLPTAKELYTLVQNIDIERDKDPKINATYFPNIMLDEYWSSTSHINNSDCVDCAWYVEFLTGTVSPREKPDANYVLAVRGAHKNNNLVDNGDGTVTDTTTGLMWQKAEAGGMRWEDALNYCKILKLADHDDWRLPNIKELQSIVNYTKYKPSINSTIFSETIPYIYFSATNYTFNEGDAWVINFSNGHVGGGGNKLERWNVRAVRGGQ